MSNRKIRLASVLVIAGLLFVPLVMILLAIWNPTVGQRYGLAFIGLLVEGTACVSFFVLLPAFKPRKSVSGPSPGGRGQREHRERE